MSKFLGFIRTLSAHWFTAMSGGLSVPLAIAGITAPDSQSKLKIGLIVTAFVCFFAAAFDVWRRENERAEDIAVKYQQALDELKPKIRLLFSEDIPGCKVLTQMGLGYKKGIDPRTGASTFTPAVTATIYDAMHPVAAIPSRKLVTYYRVAIEPAFRAPIHRCSACIEAIDKNSQPIFAGQNLILPFEGAEKPDANVRDIQRREYLDVFAITEEDKVLLTTHGWVFPLSHDMEALLHDPARYVIHVCVSSNESAAERISIELDWTGKRETAKARSL